MEGILHIRSTNFDQEKYNQSIKLKIQDLLDRGERAKVIAYEMCKQNDDMQLISETTGVTYDEIWETIRDIDPLMYQYMKIAEYDNGYSDALNQTVHSHK